MDRDRLAYLKTLGFESEQELRDFQKAEQERREKEEEERRAQQSREEQLQEDLQKAEREKQEAIDAAEALRWERHVSGICAELGVRNVEYAMFELERAASGMGESDELDVEAWLRERIDPEKAEQHAERLAEKLGLATALDGSIKAMGEAVTASIQANANRVTEAMAREAVKNDAQGERIRLNELALAQIGVLAKGMSALEEGQKNLDARMNQQQRNADDQVIKMDQVIRALNNLSRGPASVPPVGSGGSGLIG